MSPLTKVFVVLVTVFSIVLVALVVPFVANTENYRAKLREVESSKTSAEARARSAEAEITALQYKDSEQVALKEAENRQLTGQRNELASRLAEKTSEVEGLRSARDKAEAGRTILEASHKQLLDVAKVMQDELKEVRKGYLDRSEENTKLATTVRVLESTKGTLERQLRQLQEQVAGVQERNKQIEEAFAKLDPAQRAQLLGNDPTASVVFESASPIHGKVTAIQQVGSDAFVQVNVGKNDGVQPNMKFLIHRGNTFLGTLVITTVDARASAGRVTLASGDVTSGDQVLSGMQ